MMFVKCLLTVTVPVPLRQQLDGMENIGHSSLLMYCDLGRDHSGGLHFADCGPGRGSTTWWIRWDPGEDPELVELPDCHHDYEDDRVSCRLMQGHPGHHT